MSVFHVSPEHYKNIKIYTSICHILHYRIEDTGLLKSSYGDKLLPLFPIPTFVQNHENVVEPINLFHFLLLRSVSKNSNTCKPFDWKRSKELQNFWMGHELFASPCEYNKLINVMTWCLHGFCTDFISYLSLFSETVVGADRLDFFDQIPFIESVDHREEKLSIGKYHSVLLHRNASLMCISCYGSARYVCGRGRNQCEDESEEFIYQLLTQWACMHQIVQEIFDWQFKQLKTIFQDHIQAVSLDLIRLINSYWQSSNTEQVVLQHIIKFNESHSREDLWNLSRYDNAKQPIVLSLRKIRYEESVKKANLRQIQLDLEEEKLEYWESEENFCYIDSRSQIKSQLGRKKSSSFKK